MQSTCRIARRKVKSKIKERKTLSQELRNCCYQIVTELLTRTEQLKRLYFMNGCIFSRSCASLIYFSYQCITTIVEKESWQLHLWFRPSSLCFSTWYQRRKTTTLSCNNNQQRETNVRKNRYTWLINAREHSSFERLTTRWGSRYVLRFIVVTNRATYLHTMIFLRL